MGSFFYPSSTRMVLLIAFLSQLLPSRYLPAKIPGAYVTQISDGQVQAHVPLASTPSPTAKSIVFPSHTILVASYSASSTVKVPASLTRTAPLTGDNLVNAATTEKSDSSAVSKLSQSAQSDEPGTMPASQIPHFADNATETPVAIAESSSRALEVVRTSSPSVEQDPVVPVQGAGDEGSSTDGGPAAPTPSPTNPTSVQSATTSENLASKWSQSSATLDPSQSDSHTSPGSSIPITIGSSSQPQTEPLSNTNPNSPLSTNVGSVTPGSGEGVIGDGDISSDSAAQPTELIGQTSSSDILGHADPEALDSLSAIGDMPTSASTTETPPPTKEPQLESPSKLPFPVSPTESPPSNDPSPVGPQLPLPTLNTEAASAGLIPPLTEASLDGPADPLANSIPGGESTPSPVLPEAPAPSQNAAILPQPTLESSSKTSGAIVGIPTATWTTAPPDLKEVVVTNTAWTRDTLITTTSPGIDEPTVVPVFANCEGCGPGGSLIVFGVSIPLISYHLPKIPGFPPIPRFHLPCVLFCPSSNGPPPGSSSSQDNDTPPQPGPPEREEENAEDDEDTGENNQDDKNDDKDDDRDDNQDNQDDDQNDQDDDQDNQDDDQDDDQEDNQDDRDDDQDEEEMTSRVLLRRPVL